MPPRAASALASDSAATQRRRQEQYAGTCKRAFAKAHAAGRASPKTPGEWGSLYVSVASNLVAQMRKRYGSSESTLLVSERASFRTGYGLFFTHAVVDGELMTKPGSAAYSHEDEGRAWKEFCRSTNRDDRPEAERAAEREAHARAVATLRDEKKGVAAENAFKRRAIALPPVGAAPQDAIARQGAALAARGVGGIFPERPDPAEPQADRPRGPEAIAKAVYANSYQLALGNGPGPRMRSWPRIEVPPPPRRAVENALLPEDPSRRCSVRMLGYAQSIEDIADRPGSALDFQDWVQTLGFCELSNGDVRELVRNVKHIAAELDRKPCDLSTDDLRDLAHPRGGSEVKHRLRMRAGLVPLAFGSYNSVWMLARDVAKAPLPFLSEDPSRIVFRLPLRDAMNTYASKEQAVDEVASMIDAAHAGFGVPVYATCLVSKDGVPVPETELRETSHRVCAVLYRGMLSCDQRLGGGVRLLDVKGAPPPFHPLRSYFEALNNSIWLMSLKRRINLDAKLANFIDTYTGLDAASRKGCVYAIDLDSTTYQRLPIGTDARETRSGDEQGWRPVYLYNALVISVQLRTQMRPEEYAELWWSWMREPLSTLLTQVRAARDARDDAYDAEFRDAAAFVGGLKWAGPLPGRDLPERPEIDNPREVTAWSAEAYAGYYLYGAYSKYLAPASDCCMRGRLQQHRAKPGDPGVVEREAREDVASWYKANYRTRFAPLLRFFADRRAADRKGAAALVDVMFEFANAPWSALVRTFVDVEPAAVTGIRRLKRWEPLMTGETAALRAAGLAYDDLPGWRALAIAAGGVRPEPEGPS